MAKRKDTDNGESDRITLAESHIRHAPPPPEPTPPSKGIGPFDFDKVRGTGNVAGTRIVILGPTSLYEADGVYPEPPANVAIGANGWNLVVLADSCMYSYIGPFRPRTHSPGDRSHDSLAGEAAYMRVGGAPFVPPPDAGPQ